MGNKEPEKLKARNSKGSAYARGFKKRNREQFIKGQLVAVKKLPYHKDTSRYTGTGRVIEDLDNDSYLIKVGDSYEKRNHADLKGLPKGTAGITA